MDLALRRSRRGFVGRYGVQGLGHQGSGLRGS